MNLTRAGNYRLPRFLSALVLMIAWPVCARAETREAPTIGLRIEWFANHAEAWQGEWQLSNGRIERFRSLGMGVDDAGTMWLDNEVLHLRRRSPRQTDALDVWVTAPLEATLRMSVPLPGQPGMATELSLKIKEVCQRTREFSLGPNEKIRIGRLSGDTLRCAVDRPHLIFRPNEIFQSRVAINLVRPRHRGISGTLRWQLRAAQNPSELAGGAIPFETTPNLAHPLEAPLTFPAPATEGVYELQLSLLGRGLEAIETRLQFVVLSGESPKITNGPLAEGKLVDAFEPKRAGLTRRLVNWSGSNGSDRSGALQFPWRKQGPLAAADSGDDSRLIWNGYRLQVPHPQRPHRLVVTLPAASSQEIGVALTPANPRAEGTASGLDAGVSLGRGSRPTGRNDNRPLRCEWLLWPGAADPTLIIHNLQSGDPVEVLQVSLYELDETLPAAPTAGEVANSTSEARRLVGPYLHKPLLVRECTGTSGSKVPTGVCDDWESQFQAARRLIELARFQGENALLLAVSADGSSIYPSVLLEPSPLYDRGELAGGALDPRRKDVLELLFRMCDRAGLVLVPELQFQTPLPELERLLRENPTAADGIFLKNTSGQTQVVTPVSGKVVLSQYNPLDPRVQQAVRNVVHELTERYREHSSFRGVALELSPRGSLQLPGLEWGCDTTTLARFARETGLPVPLVGDQTPDVSKHSEKLLAYLTTAARQQWSAWRCREVTRFHRLLAADVAAAKPGSIAFLSGKRIFSETEAGEGTSRIVRTGGSSRESLRASGLDFSQYTDKDPVLLLQPSGGAALGSGSRRSAIERLGYTTSTTDSAAAARSGRLVQRLPARIELRSTHRPLSPETVTVLTPAVFVHGAALRQPYTAALAGGDAYAIFESSEPLSRWQDESLRRVRQSVASLPALPFQNALSQPLQPLIVSSATVRGATYLYAVNEADLPLRVELHLGCPFTVHARRLGSSAAIELGKDENEEVATSRLSFVLEGHDLWCARLEASDVKVTEARVVPAPEGLGRFREQIDALQANLTAWERSSAHETSQTENAGFEQRLVAGAVPAWDLPVGEASGWQLDSREPHSGKWSLQLSGGGNGPRLTSRPLALDASRQVSATLWLRGSRPGLRVNLSWHGEGESRLQQTEITVDADWQRFAAKAKGLPAGRTARFMVEPIDEGHVWIDDVNFQTSGHSPHDLRQATKMLSALNMAWEEHRYSDCQHLLDGHWGRLLQLPPSPTIVPEAPAKIRFVERLNPTLHR